MREIISLNEGWTFFKSDVGIAAARTGTGEKVSVPHTWNAIDGHDGNGDYYREKCWYTRRFDRPASSENNRVWLEFKAVNACAEVFVNGRSVITHRGGYSAFRADITDELKDENIICVSADNRKADDLYPRDADFTFYGGIYRDVNLIITSKAHFDLAYRGSLGVKIDASVDGDVGRITVTTRQTDGEARIMIKDREGRVATVGKSGETLIVKQPRLWDGINDPYLYTATATLFAGGTAVDEVVIFFGFRTYHADAEKGFFLNGKPYPLRGVCRHQDRPVIGNALTKQEHEEDMALIRELGANSIRLAHYQHDDYFYELCDKYGMVVWAEIPYISEHLNDGDENALEQMKDLIEQNYNHPSIIFWGVSNEVTMKECDTAKALNCHKKLLALCKKLDPSRVTTIAHYSQVKPEHPLAAITDVVAHNLYCGWYVPDTRRNGEHLDMFHKALPAVPQGLSEFGAEGLPYLHSDRPRRGDNTEEYQCFFHERLLEIIEERPWLWCAYVWNMFDFGANHRKIGGDNGKNHKGLVSFDRKTRKDTFYLYKAYLSKEPFVHICGKRFAERTGRTLKIKVYSNQSSVELLHNGVSAGKQEGRRVFEFELPMSKINEIKAVSGDCADNAVIRRVWFPKHKFISQRGKYLNWLKES